LPYSPDLDVPPFDDAELEAFYRSALSRSAAMRVGRTHRRTIAGGLVGAALLAVALLVAIPGTSVPHQGHAGSQLAVGGRSAAGHWRLVSDVSGSWQTLPSSDYLPQGLPALNLICPTTATCYAANWEATGPGTASELVVTHDGGNTWQPSVLPVTLSQPPSLACVDAETCAIVGIDGSGNPTFLETTDGGQAWSSHAGPNGLSSVIGARLTCTTAQSCLVVAAGGASGSATALMPDGDAFAFVTDDGGNTWSTSSLPIGLLPSGLQCISATSCVASGASVGKMYSDSNPATPTGAILYTTDGGSSWNAAAVPSGFSGFGLVSSLSCSESGDCLVTSSSGGPGVISNELLDSTDGGETWSIARGNGLPQGVVISVSCPGNTDCWATGVTRTPGESGNINLGAAGFATSSADGGGTWQQTQIPQGVGAVLDISCPSDSTCYALGVQQAEESGNGEQPFVLLVYGSATSAGS
jgi:photosystem II stability/assembly factor-like uncharacterized protein